MNLFISQILKLSTPSQPNKYMLHKDTFSILSNVILDFELYPRVKLKSKISAEPVLL